MGILPLSRPQCATHTAVCYFFLGRDSDRTMNRSGERILRAGDCLENRYRIVKPIGEGGMGSVYLAEDLRLNGQKWAVKWIPQQGGDMEQPMKEAKMMIDLQHPSLPRIVDIIPMKELGGSCLVMDYLAGETLLERSLAFAHIMPWESVVGYASQLCDLLHYLHSRDTPIVFRDVKPSNVIIGHDGLAKLIDFGIARTYKAGKTADTEHIGSVGFAAPELIANRQTDHRADLYSLGGLMYFLLCGGQYYNFTKIPLSQAAPHIPPSLAAAVERLLCEEPKDRFQNALEAKKALDTCLADELQGGNGADGWSMPRIAPVAAERRIIAVNGLFPGAGATYISVALAKFMAERRIRVAYVECPWQQGDSMLAMYSESRGTESVWQEGTLCWNLTTERYDAEERPFRADTLYKMFLETKADVYIVDVSSEADVRAAEAIIQLADEVVAVVAPDPALLRRPQTLANWERITTGAPNRVRWVANRVPGAARIPDFFRLFTQRPDCTVPEFPYDVIVASKWKGRWSQEDQAIQPSLEHSLRPLLDSFAPEAAGGTQVRSRGIGASAKRWLARARKS
jgi:eukaryotic-like serine/threonine-protein kinase